MKIIFFGTPSFSANTLEYLIKNGHEILAVVSTPDSKRGRGKKIHASEVKTVAVSKDIPVFQPEKLNDIDFAKKLKSCNADLFVVVAFRMLPEIIWKIPKKGTINLHTSLLPHYRGAAPLNRVLINGDPKTGITTFFINNKIDAGEILMQKSISLNQDTTVAQLHNFMIRKGSILLNKTIKAIEKDNLKRTVQSYSSTMPRAPKITKDLLRIDWNNNAEEIHNLVRGLSPVLENGELLKDVAICPSAWFILQDHNKNKKRIKLQLTKLLHNTENAHLSIDTDNYSYLRITINNRCLDILRLQVEGKKSMDIKQFLTGNKINSDFKIL